MDPRPGRACPTCRPSRCPISIKVGTVTKQFQLLADATGKVAVNAGDTVTFTITVKNWPNANTALRRPRDAQRGHAAAGWLGVLVHDDRSRRPRAAPRATLTINTSGMAQGKYHFYVRATGMNGDSPPRKVTMLLPLDVNVSPGTAVGNGDYLDISGWAVMRITSIDVQHRQRLRDHASDHRPRRPPPAARQDRTPDALVAPGCPTEQGACRPWRWSSRTTSGSADCRDDPRPRAGDRRGWRRLHDDRPAGPPPRSPPGDPRACSWRRSTSRPTPCSTPPTSPCGRSRSTRPTRTPSATPTWSSGLTSSIAILAGQVITPNLFTTTEPLAAFAIVRPGESFGPDSPELAAVRGRRRGPQRRRRPDQDRPPRRPDGLDVRQRARPQGRAGRRPGRSSRAP